MPDATPVPARFQHATAKLTIGTTDQQPNFHVDAQYNPKELQVERSVPWSQQNMANAGGPTEDAPGELHLEYTGAQGRTISVEMLFDGYEEGRCVAEWVDTLEAMATVADPTSPIEANRRPPHCVVSWGDRGVPRLRCVIEQLAIKYTMFASDGTPLRAVCTVKLREATKLTLLDPSVQRHKRRVA